MPKQRKVARVPPKKKTLVRFLKDKVEALQGLVQEWEETLQKFIFTSAQEFGKVWANQQQIAGSIEHIDLNTLALSKLVKKLWSEKYQGKEDFEQFYVGIEAEAFEAVHRELEEERKKIQEQKEKEAEKLIENEKEMEKKSNIVVDASEGGGEIPEEATIFGG